ncbi:MAG TPA: hypothetical protein VJ873_01105 [bacterium]|nr:hypothetical protein [bacterium]
MVKTIAKLGVMAVLMAFAMSCNKSSSPVIPAGASVLHLSVPPKVQAFLTKSSQQVSSKGVASLSGMGALEYNLSTPGQAPVTGVITFSDSSQIGNIFINLPTAGQWLVSAEFFSLFNPLVGSKNPSAKLVIPGLNATPQFVGAGMVNVQGTTSFTLNMEDIDTGTESGCYNGNLTDSTSLEFPSCGGAWVDLYTFDTGVEAASNTSTASVADIQALYDPVTTNSTYLGGPTGAQFAYLGNGDLVNFPMVPAGTTFYPDTVSAKAAVAGTASAAITVNDIFVVKGPETNQMVWLQVWIDNIFGSCSAPANNSSLMQFWFVYNNEGLNYMKFDETTNGRINCNQNTIPTSTPTPTATP